MKIVERVLSLLSTDCYLSGEEIAEKLHVSRNAVWKAVNDLRENGYRIEARTNRGYRLLEKKLSAEMIGLPLKTIVLDTVDSTNTACKRYAQTETEDLLVVALSQTGGRGRLGRSFFSPAGGVYFSLLLHPDCRAEESLSLTVAAAVAAARAAERCAKSTALIKWVNDIYLDGKKVCGILAESAFNVETSLQDYVIVGIGFNLNPPQGGFPPEIAKTATSLLTAPDESAQTKAELIRDTVSTFLTFYHDKKRSYLQEYKSRSMLTGKEVTYTKDGQSFCSTVTGIDDNARLLLRDENGRDYSIFAGEVSVRIKKV